MDIEDHGESNLDTNIKVAVRCRPLNSKERANGEQTCVKVYPDQIILTNPDNKTEEHSFAFDLVFPDDISQEEVWCKVGQPILGKAIAGYNSTIFAYGQTGSGKTWSMQGGDGDLQGIIPRMNVSLFERISEERKTRPTIQFLVTVSYFEIYNEVIFDLLDPTDRKKKSSKGGLEIKEHPALGVYVKGLQEIVVDTASKLSSIVDQGMKNRTVASTQMNADSSRSHSVFMITVHQKDEEDPSKNIFAKINLVDLAGSERVKSTGATGATLKEGANINKSLSALGNVINALVEAGKGKAVFIPYRNSKLTRVLQESLGGNSITSMLAAMSPAACNFDETLSTLKYANRAKAIKVKAVKNEEASAVSRLNDEIRMLKEKLAQNLSAGGEGTGVMSEKNKQQLKELEEAVRNTWEAKTKMSAEHEQERQRLLQEQQLAAQQLQSAKERSWMILEQKGLVELTIAHVKELSKFIPSVSVEVDNWSDIIAKAFQLEKSAGEQFTVIQVFRSSIEKDSKQLAKVSGLKDGKRIDDVVVMNSVNQLKEKVVSMTEEISNWTQTHRTLDGIMRNLHNEINGFVASFKNSILIEEPGDAEGIISKKENSISTSALPSSAEDAALATASHVDKLEIVRGFQLVVKQLVVKQNNVRQQWCDGQVQLCNFKFLIGDLKVVTSSYHVSLSQLFNGESTASGPTTSKIMTDIKQLIERIDADLLHFDKKTVKPSPASDESQLPHGPIPFGIHGEYTSLKAVGNDKDKEKDLQSSTKKPLISSNNCFVYAGNSPSKSLHVKLHEVSSLLCLKVGGCRYFGTKMVHPGDADRQLSLHYNASEVRLQTASDNHEILSLQQIKLPCGIGLVDCNGDIDSTTSAIGDILDWSILLKKNPPDKFLKRPPVRFLFDLFKHIAEQYPGCLPPHIETADWATVGVSKESKTEFMDAVIQFVALEAKCEIKTSGASIITGADPELTNELLQQLAVLVYRFYVVNAKSKQSTTITNENRSGELSNDISKVSVALETKEKKVVTSAVVRRLEISFSDAHGEILSWKGGTKSSFAVPLRNHDDIFEIKLDQPLRAQFVTITPLEWTNSEFPDIPAFRLELVGYNDSAVAQNRLAPILDDKVLINAVTDMEDVLSTMISLVTKINSFEQSEKARRQEEMKKNMEMLAQEKAALAQALANEKDALMSNNQDLTDQLKKCFSQLQETTALLEKEQQLNLQLEKNRVAMEEEKFSLQQLLAERDQENAKLQTATLKLETALEKEKAANIETQKLLQDKLELVESLQGDLQYAIKSRDVLEQEKEELQHQIAVLIEERDAARSHEEELFEKLTDVTNDLEKLQESYVDIADRCNDAQDEVSELRDQIQNLQEALALQRAAFAKTVHTSPLNNNDITSAHSSGRSEPKAPFENGGSSHKRSAKSVSIQKQSSGRSMEFNRAVDNETGKELLISADDSKHISKGNTNESIVAASQKSKSVEEDYYQEDFDDFQE